MDFGLDPYGLSVLTIFLLLIPAAFYAMGIMEGRWGFRLFVAGLGLHLLSIAQRWLVTGRIPLAEKHDNISFMAMVTALGYVYFFRRHGMRNLPLVTVPLVSVLLLVAAAHGPINTVSPFMNSPFFYLHTFFYFLSYGLFGISAAIGVFYLIGGSPEHEQLQYRGAMYGWMALSISLFAGSIWFYTAYGTYWLWTSKELWISITWLCYGLYLHARLMRGLRGRPASLLGFLGFAVALFTYFGVGTVIKSPPSQF